MAQVGGFMNAQGAGDNPWATSHPLAQKSEHSVSVRGREMGHLVSSSHSPRCSALQQALATIRYRRSSLNPRGSLLAEVPGSRPQRHTQQLGQESDRDIPPSKAAGAGVWKANVPASLTRCRKSGRGSLPAGCWDIFGSDVLTTCTVCLCLL